MEPTGTRFDSDTSIAEPIFCVGVGSFGRTYVCKCNGGFVALKVAIDALDEAEIQSIKDHGSNLTILYRQLTENDLEFFDGENQFFFMDYIPGTTLHEYLEFINDNQLEMKPVTKFKILLGVIQGISKLHSEGVIHRDIKPGNIFLDNFLNPHLGDFGDVSDHAFTANVHGTLNFLPPEANLSPIPMSTGYDIFEFGGTAFQLITREWPFNDIEQEQILDLISRGNRDSRIDNGQIFIAEEDKPIYEIIKRCWAQNYEDRPTAEQLCGEIYALAQQQLSTDEFNELYEYLTFAAGENQYCGSDDNVFQAINDGFGVISPAIKAIAEKYGLQEGSSDVFLEKSTRTRSVAAPMSVRAAQDYSLLSIAPK